MSKHSPIPPGEHKWLRDRAADLRHLPDPDEEPFRYDELDECVAQHFRYLEANDILDAVEVTGGPDSRTRWRVTPHYREVIDDIVCGFEAQESGPLPCDCPFAVRNHGWGYECRHCGEEWTTTHVELYREATEGGDPATVEFYHRVAAAGDSE